MNAQVCVGVRFGEVGCLEKPRAGDQDAGGGDPVLLERFGNGAVHRVVHAVVVSMEDEQAGRRRVAESLLHGFGLRLGEDGGEG